MTGSTVLGIGSYRPVRRVGNDVVADRIGHDTEWIRSRSCIESRGHATDGETLEMMAAAAGRKAISHAGIQPSELDSVIIASCTNLRPIPAVAPVVAHLVSADTAGAFDLNSACAGFCYGLGVARALIATGSAGHVLLVGVDRMTDVVDPQDDNTAFLFGDGAGAVVLGPSDRQDIGPVVWGSDGGQAGVLSMTGSWNELINDRTVPTPVLAMQGRSLQRWVRREVVAAAHRAMSEAGVEWSRLRAFVPHQANGRLIDILTSLLELPEGVAVARDVVTAGNTSSASIPLALDHLLGSGTVHRGDIALTVGFGAGLSYAAQVIRLP